MNELILKVSEIEGAHPERTLHAFAMSGYDVVRVKANGGDEFGSISLLAAEELFESGREMLASAASHEATERADRTRGGRLPEAAKDYVSKVRMGQTERGSFILTLLSPYSYMPPKEAPQLFREAFGRRVVERLETSLIAVETALQLSTALDVEIFEGMVEAGVSAKLCRALTKIVDASDGAEISVTWSVERPVARQSTFELPRHTSAILSEAASMLAERAPPELVSVRGTIVGVMESASDLAGTVRIWAEIEGRGHPVQTHFDAFERSKIFKAFQEKRLFLIAVDGELDRTTRPWTLRQPRNLDLVEFETI